MFVRFELFMRGTGPAAETAGVGLELLEFAAVVALDPIGGNWLDKSPRVESRNPFGEVEPRRPSEPKFSGGSVVAVDGSSEACNDGDAECLCDGRRRCIVDIDCACDRP